MKKVNAESLPVVHTIGHSTRTLEDFISLLREYGVQKVRVARAHYWKFDDYLR